MAFVASCVSVRMVQVPAGHPVPCCVHLFQGSSSTALHTGLQRAKGAGSSHVSMPGKGDRPGRLIPSIPPRCGCSQVKTPHQHSSVSDCLLEAICSYIILPCFATVRENLYLWTCSGSKNQLVKIQLKQYFSTKQRPKQPEEFSCTDLTRITDI